MIVTAGFRWQKVQSFEAKTYKSLTVGRKIRANEKKERWKSKFPKNDVKRTNNKSDMSAKKFENQVLKKRRFSDW